jgi:hypothetical protein
MATTVKLGGFGEMSSLSMMSGGFGMETAMA